MIILRNKIITLYHITPTSKVASILKYGLDSELGKPLEMTKKEIQEWEKKTGTKMKGFPYHYTHFPKTLYLSTDPKDSDSYAAHYNSFENSGGSCTLLEINMPESLFKKLQCESPKLLGSRNWREYKKNLEKYEPEVLAYKKSLGATEKELDEKVKKMWDKEQGRVCVRGNIAPGYIKIVKEIKK